MTVLVSILVKIPEIRFREIFASSSENLILCKSNRTFPKIQKPGFTPDLSLFHTTFWKEKLFRDVLLPLSLYFQTHKFLFLALD